MVGRNCFLFEKAQRDKNMKHGDITKKKQISEEEYRLVVDNTDEIIVVIQDGMVIFSNRRAAEITGYSQEELSSKAFEELIHPDDQEIIVEHLLDRLKGEELRLVSPLRMIDKEGNIRWLEIKTVAITWDGKPATLNFLTDITERTQAEQELAYMATHDPLTGLPNRMLFNDRLNLELAHAQRNQKRLAVMLLDLDRFKDVNDTLGHSVGDQLLQAVGGRLARLMRKSDTVARMGGDEFLLLLPEITWVEDPAKIAQKVLDAFRQTFVFDGHELYITPSIGIAIYPPDGEDADTLVRNADIAMYRAKEGGRNNYQRYPVLTK